MKINQSYQVLTNVDIEVDTQEIANDLINRYENGLTSGKQEDIEIFGDEDSLMMAIKDSIVDALPKSIEITNKKLTVINRQKEQSNVVQFVMELQLPVIDDIISFYETSRPDLSFRLSRIKARVEEELNRIKAVLILRQVFSAIEN